MGGRLKPKYWKGLYKSNYDWWCKESYSHPAKMAPALAWKIIETLEMGLLKEGDCILDFMSGIGTTNIAACLRGYKTISVELEDKFIDMCKSYWCLGIPKVTVTEIILPAQKKGWKIWNGSSVRTFTSKEEAEKWAKDFKKKYFVGATAFYSKALPERKKYKVASKCRCGKSGWHKCHWIVGNKERLEKKLGHKVDWTILQGDSRQLSKLLSEKGLCGVVSPPYNIIVKDSEYLDSINRNKLQKSSTGQRRDENSQWFKTFKAQAEGYSNNPSNYSNNPSNYSNIGNLKDKPLIGITSPPYTHESYTKASKKYKKIRVETGRHPDINPSDQAMLNPNGYGTTNGQIANLPDRPFVAMTSPPYGNIAAQFRNTGSKLDGDKFQYGSNDWQNIGNLADEADYQDETKAAWWRRKAANQQPETYLQAMLQCYQEAAKVCRVLVTVTKNPTRNGKLRRLDLDTKKLLEMAGFKIVAYYRSLLFEEKEETNLFGKTKKKVNGRLSFFKRLAYQKGSPIAQWEDVFICENTEN